MMAGGYAAVFLSSLVPVPFLLLLPAVALVTFVLGVAVALVAYFPLMRRPPRSEEHTSELQSLMRISYAVFCLKKKKYNNKYYNAHNLLSTILELSQHTS